MKSLATIKIYSLLPSSYTKDKCKITGYSFLKYHKMNTDFKIYSLVKQIACVSSDQVG